MVTLLPIWEDSHIVQWFWARSTPANELLQKYSISLLFCFSFSNVLVTCSSLSFWLPLTLQSWKIPSSFRPCPSASFFADFVLLHCLVSRERRVKMAALSFSGPALSDYRLCRGKKCIFLRKIDKWDNKSIFSFKIVLRIPPQYPSVHSVPSFPSVPSAPISPLSSLSPLSALSLSQFP